MHPKGMPRNGRFGSVEAGPVENWVLPERHVLSDTGHTATVHARQCHAGSAGRSGFSLFDEAIMQKTENRMSAVRFSPEPSGIGAAGVQFGQGDRVVAKPGAISDNARRFCLL